MKIISLLSFLLFFSLSANAGDFGTLKKKLSLARESLLTLVKDTTKRGAEQQKLVHDTANDVSSYLSEIKAPKGKDKQWEEYKATWKDFKETREKDIVPSVLAGKQAEADKLANGIQKERLDKMNRILDDLTGKDL